MAHRIVKTFREAGDLVCCVVRVNAEYEEYVCELTRRGKRLPDADYFTDCKADAVRTAQTMFAACLSTI